ncbi:MAG TPA: PadR family transcriptional regulator [Longimicrobiales bacterium]|nr:PadR family transcriptional regulator [Longimicrobiales bacterium]
MPIDPTAPLNPRHYLILLLLAEQSTWGVRLMERIEARSDGGMRFNAGSLYRTIAQLVDAGWVTPLRDEAPEDGVGAPRKVYGLTEDGRDAIRREAERQAAWLDSARSLGLAEPRG